MSLVSSSKPIPLQRRAMGRALGVLVFAAVLAACVPTGARPELSDETIPDGTDGAGTVTVDCPEPSGSFGDFSAAVILVESDDGTLERCVLVADTGALRSQGLMEASGLGGYDAMLFAFADDSVSGFWMSNTELPLSIAFIAADGQVVSTADMDPCPERVDCPTYAPDGPYRWAIEVPRGDLGEFGLDEDGSLDPASLPVAFR